MDVIQLVLLTILFVVQNPISMTIRKKTETVEADKGFALAPSAKDLNPWYSEKSRVKNDKVEDEDDNRR